MDKFSQSLHLKSAQPLIKSFWILWRGRCFNLSRWLRPYLEFSPVTSTMFGEVLISESTRLKHWNGRTKFYKARKQQKLLVNTVTKPTFNLFIFRLWDVKHECLYRTKTSVFRKLELSLNNHRARRLREREEKKREIDYKVSFEWRSHHSILERIGVVLVLENCVWRKVQHSSQCVSNSISSCLVARNAVPHWYNILLKINEIVWNQK